MRSIFEVARQVYQVHQDITHVAVEECRRRVAEAGQTDALQEWAVRELLNKARLQANHPIYAKAHGLRERLSVEVQPAGYRDPTAVTTEPTSSGAPAQVSSWRTPSIRATSIVVPSQERAIELRPVPIAAFRTILSLKLRLGTGSAVMVREMKKPDIARAIGQLRSTEVGCRENREILQSLLNEMRADERGIDAVRRLERRAVA